MSTKTHSQLDTLQWLFRALSPFVSAAELHRNFPVTESDLANLIRISSQHLVLPSLYLRLQDKGMLSNFSNEFVDALEGFYQLNILHNTRLRQQMIDVSYLLNSIGIEPVWLKGATVLMTHDWHRSPRMMLDLDFWIAEPQQQQATLACLEQAGYQIPEDYSNHDDSTGHHFNPRMRTHEPARLEIHHHIVSTQLGKLLSNQDALKHMESLTWEGCRVGQLSASDRLMHSYIQCTEMNRDGLSRGHIALMKTLDFVERVNTLGGRYPDDFLAKLDHPPWQKQARRFLTLVDHEFGLRSPLAADNGLRNRQRWCMSFPRGAYALYICKHAYDSLSAGHTGPLRDWWPKLLRHLQIMRQS
nr:nucleotidyltransferase family protein [uncultured Rhodoferax sp.]